MLNRPRRRTRSRLANDPIADHTILEDSARLKKINVAEITLQLRWYESREMKFDKKTEILALSKLNKQQKVDILLVAIKRRNQRIEEGEIIPERSSEVEALDTDMIYRW